MVGHRPSDWHVLDLDKDPTPGDPQRVRTLAKTLHDFADDVSEALRLVKGMAGETRTSTTSRSENFAVRVLATPPPSRSEGAGEALGCIRVGEFEERFPMSLSYWSVVQYEASWRRCLGLLVEGGPDTTSCLVTSITDPANSNFLFCWPLYRSGSVIYVQNSIIFLNELAEEFAPDEPWRFVEPRSTVDEDGQAISEWRTTVQDVEEFLRTGAL